VSGPTQRPTTPGVAGLQSPQRRRLYEQLIQQLLSFVELKGLVVGDRLPSERDLALALHVSRTSVRQATVALEVQGILEVRHGDGIYLKARPDDPSRLVELMARRHRLPAVLEAREALETQLAALAAARRSEGDMNAIDAALSFMAEDVANGGLGLAGDEGFHAAVTAAASSPLLSQLMDALASAIGETRLSSLSEPGRPPQSLAAHKRIAEAIRRQDPSAARRAMRRHLEVVADVGLLRWEAADSASRGAGLPAHE
jgi:GntR family transcriptional regulator, transcriptional repressor for pyruvate dehydrogenase complex